MTETSFASPRSGNWSLPETELGRSDTPVRPTGVRLLRTRMAARNGTTRPVVDEIPCKVIYAGRDADAIDWWVVRTVTDEWILPADQIVCSFMPATARLSNAGAR